MLLKNSEITAAKQALAGIMNVKIPVKNSLQIARLDVRLNEPVEAFVQVRDGLFKKYNMTQRDGQFTSDTRENLEGFVSEFNELLAQEVEFEFTPIDLPEIEVEPKVLQLLEKFIK